MGMLIAFIIIFLKLTKSCYSTHNMFSFPTTSMQPDPTEDTTILYRLDAIASCTIKFYPSMIDGHITIYLPPSLN